jgi:hypothetical protein
MIKFWANNLVDQATLTASTENAQFPVENIQDPRRTKVFRSTSNSDNIVLDFGETSEFDSVLIVENPLNGFGISTITIQANTTNSWSSPPFSQAVTFSSEHGVGIAEFSTQQYRFARIVMTSTLGYCELPNIFIGMAIQPSRGVNLGWTYKDEDLSITKKNRYGQKFSDIIARQRIFSGVINNLDKDDMDDIFEIYDAKGEVNPFFVQIGCDETINDIRRF